MPHDHHFELAARSDEPRDEPARQADDERAQHRGAEAVNDEIRQQGRDQLDHQAVDDQQE